METNLSARERIANTEDTDKSSYILYRTTTRERKQDVQVAMLRTEVSK